MSEEITIKGLWWLPGSPDKQLPGDITYSSTHGARLILFDHLFQDSTLDRFTVWGITVSGKPISLFNCYTKSLTMHLPGARVAEISSYFGVIGGHFDSPNEMKFIKVTADLSYLHDWACTSGINARRKDSGKGWQVTQEVPADISLGAVNDFKLALEFTGNLKRGFGDYRLTENCIFTVEAKALTDYGSFENVVHQFQHFVALAVSRPVYALSIKARINTPKKMYEGQPIYDDFEIIQKLSLKDHGQKGRIPHDMQFCLTELKPKPSDYIERFFSTHGLLHPVCELYFSTLYHQDMYVQQRFLALAHAIEAYHRVFVGGKYQSNDIYQNGLQKRLWDAIPQDLDPDFRASLKNKLKYLHEFSLRKRVQDICLNYDSVLRPFLGEVAQFAGAVADQRNQLTHPDSTAENGLPKTDWGELWLKSEQLSLLLEVCLLHELGFDQQAILKLLPRNRRTSAIQLNR